MEQNLTFADLGLSKEILQALEQKGYDDEEGIVYVSDSISGDVTRDARVFFSTWQMMDSQAVAIE